MGQVQRRSRLLREICGHSKPKVFLRPFRAVWPNVAAFEDSASRATPPMEVKEFAEHLAQFGITTWYDAADGLIKASRE